MTDKGIRTEDIKLLESQRMTDDPDAGGPPTSREVRDGETNNIFPDVSRLDRAYGRVSMRKVFGGVHTEGTQTYHGAHAIVGERAKDENVEVLLFDTGGSLYDERREAREHVEGYLIPAERRRYHLYGEHLQGMSQLQVSAPTGESAPRVGETLALEHEDTGDTLYVRVANVSTETTEHTENGQTFTRRTMTITTARPLPRNLEGVDPQPSWDDHGSPWVIRGMRVADAARYYGAGELARDVEPGDEYIRLRDLYAQIVPTTEREEVVSDERALEEMVHHFQAGGDEVEVPSHVHTFFLAVTQETRGTSWTAYLRPLPEPGTLRIYWRALGNWEVIEDEDGEGGLTGRGTGTVNYDNGAVTFTTQELPDAPSEIMLQWGSQAAFLDRSGRTVSTGNRPPQLVQSVGDSIMPGSLTVTWLSGDEERTATDNGEGVIEGDATGRVAYTSGDIALVPDTYPDPDTRVRYEYSKCTKRVEVINPADPPEGASIPTGAAPGSAMDAADGTNVEGTSFIGGSSISSGNEVEPITYTVEHAPIKPGSVVLRWTVGRGHDFREHFQDFAAHEHALKRILTRDRDRDVEIPEGKVEPGYEFDLPGGAREVKRVEDANGDSIPGDWYEVEKGEPMEEGYRPPTALVFTDKARPDQGIIREGTESDLMVTQAQDLPQPGRYYIFGGSRDVTAIQYVLIGANIVPSHYWSLRREQVVQSQVSATVGEEQDLPEDVENVVRVIDAKDRIVPDDLYTVDTDAATFTLDDDVLEPASEDYESFTETVSGVPTTTATVGGGLTQEIDLPLPDGARLESIDEVRFDAEAIPEAHVVKGTHSVTIEFGRHAFPCWARVRLEDDDTEVIEVTSDEWHEASGPIREVAAFYATKSDAESYATIGDSHRPVEIDGDQFRTWEPLNSDVGEIQVDFTVINPVEEETVEGPLTVMWEGGGEQQREWSQIEFSLDFDPDVYDSGDQVEVGYEYQVSYEEPLTVTYRPEDVEADEVLSRTAFGTYFALVEDVDEEDLFGQESQVGEYVREAVDDGGHPVGSLSYKAGGEPLEGGVDYESGEITWRPTAQYHYERRKDRAREEFGRIVQTAAFAGGDDGPSV